MKQDASPPHVLLISVDHWPGALLGLTHPIIRTPTLDALSRGGTRFCRSMAGTPTCIPARRSLMTGTTARTHGDRVFQETGLMPLGLTTMAEAFKAGGYQALAVGKLHVYPQRNRIGFDEAFIHEEGRHHLGMDCDDYEMYLAEKGFAGEELTHGMGVNQYHCRPWHLAESLHPTAWTAREMCRAIVRRDPSRPGFWYASFAAPHPPITPPAAYLELYRSEDLDEPVTGNWSRDEDLPYPLRIHRHMKPGPGKAVDINLTRRGFYAQCTFIDHQIRLILGTLREQNILDDTVIAFTSDHGDMLGDHGLWAKSLFLEPSAGIPLILVDRKNGGRIKEDAVDDRLCGHEDIMPTLLELCGLPVPESVEGLSLVGEKRRQFYYGEHYEDPRAMRMLRREDMKLIWYPAGNRFQLFDLARDPRELTNLADDPAYREIQTELADGLVGELYGGDEAWVSEGKLRGMPEEGWEFSFDRSLGAQRGWRF